MRRATPLLLVFVFAACEKLDRKPDALAPPQNKTVRVRIVDSGGKPVTDGTNGIWWGKPNEAFGTHAGLIDGVVVLQDIPKKPIVVVALPDGFVVASEGWPRVTVAANATEATVVLDVGGTRTLRLLGGTPGASPLVCLSATTDLEPSHHGVEDDGTIHLEGLRKGVRYNLYVREHDTNRCALLRDLAENEPWPLIELAPGGTITGRVVLPKGCENCNVAVMVDKAVVMDGTVEEDGAFSIPAVPTGTWTVVAYTTIQGRYLAATARVETGTAAVLDLTKPPK